MRGKRKNICFILFFCLLLFGTSILCMVSPAEVFSQSERRELATFPALTAASFQSGEFAEGFETYATERFPYRDTFRAIKAWFSANAMGKLDNNGLFVADGHISKIDSTENPAMMEHAAERFSYLYRSFIENKNAHVYLAIIPDKNFILAPQNGYPSLDYAGFTERMRQKLPFMTYIDVTDMLSLSDYYTTDTHWRQEKIQDVAVKIGDAMGTDVRADYEELTLENKFYGVYKGQLALPFTPDTLVYLQNEELRGSRVTYYDTGKPKKGEMYNMEKAAGKDPYEMFLSGTTPLVTIENPSAKSDRELVMFRDSFGSSIAPLLSAGYRKITLVDIRYMQSSFVGNFVDFENADVLFLYSTTLLNNSLALR